MNDVTFQRNLQSVLFDNRYDRHVAHRKSGKLNGRTINKISFSDKLFKKKEERKNKNYSIALLVDCSGSMHGPKSDVAFDAAQKLSKHLSSAKVNHAVYGFHTVTLPMKKFDTKYDNKMSEKLQQFLSEGYGLYSSEGMGISTYKHIGYAYDFVRGKSSKLRGYMSFGAGDNNDPYAVRYVAKELSKQPGTKILIVLSDGQPSYSGSHVQCAEFPKETYDDVSQDDFKKIISGILKQGIDIQSIGIMDDSVNRYYPSNKTCTIYDLAQLYDHIIKIIKINLKRT